MSTWKLPVPMRYIAVVLKKSLIVYLKDTGQPPLVNRLTVAVRICQGKSFRMFGIHGALISLKKIEEKVGKERAVNLFLDKLLLSEDNIVVDENRGGGL